MRQLILAYTNSPRRKLLYFISVISLKKPTALFNGY
ncbi:hypothetical protein CF65_01460 [Aggregatibacter actinomycetemcomitans HK1651]|nr:hypothetical protein CF65_01460 [Aggregatibacter actinomycetemcomitans HK1651]